MVLTRKSLLITKKAPTGRSRKYGSAGFSFRGFRGFSPNKLATGRYFLRNEKKYRHVALLETFVAPLRVHR